MNKLTANYHTHTYRCNHATGEDREYAEQAVKAGLKILGFSDHSPMIFPSGHTSGFRVPADKALDYFQSIRALRDEFKNELEIHVGVEVEYYPDMFDDYLDYIGSFGCEYLICGQHFIFDEEKGQSSFKQTDDESVLAAYFDNLILACQSGKFLYIAHPDLINFVGSEEIYAHHARRFLKEAAKCSVPLEINRLGLEDERHYPRDSFWQCCAEEGNPVIIGLDAHSPGPVGDLPMHRRCIEYAEKFGLNLVKDNLLNL